MKNVGKMMGAVALATAAVLTVGRPARAAGFPYDATYPNGLSSVVDSQSTADSDTLRFWGVWRDKWIVPFTGAGGGQRVLFQEPSDGSTTRTVSEGLGYGMLFCVYFGDQSRFDDLYQYVKAHLNKHGLMWNKLNADGTPYDIYNNDGTLAYDGTINATDGDEDIAAALALASKVWGSDSRYSYGAEAVARISAIKNYDVMADPNGKPVISAGDLYQSPGDPDFNPSYFAPAWYRIYQDITGDATWASVLNDGYSILNADRYSGTGLVSQDCNWQGQQYDGYSYSYTQFEYNAIRVPFRTGLDWSWFGSSSGRTIAGGIGAYYHTQINADHTNLASPGVMSARDTNGTVTGGYESGTFTGLAGVACMANGSQSDANYLYNALVYRTSYASNYSDNIDVSSYYDGAWHLFSALYESGNFPNLYGPVSGGSVTPTFTASASVSPGTSVAPGTSVTVTATVTCTAGSLQNGLAGLRVYDSSSNEISGGEATQSVTLSSGGQATVTLTFTAPPAGTYSIDAGVWTGNYSTNYLFTNVGTLTVSAGTGGGNVITGTAFDDGAGAWGGNTANAASAAFDGDVSTFYDCANASGGYTGIDSGTATAVTSVKFAPRPGFEYRMVGGVFEGSNSGTNSGYHTLATISQTPADGLTNTLTVGDTTPYRWLRYRGPDGDYCNVAEVQFVDPPAGAPGTPSGLSATAGARGTRRISLKWSAASGAVSYHILRSTKPGYTGTRASAVNVTGTGYTDSAPSAGATYYYTVTAANTHGQSVRSNQVSAKAP